MNNRSSLNATQQLAKLVEVEAIELKIVDSFLLWYWFKIFCPLDDRAVWYTIQKHMLNKAKKNPKTTYKMLLNWLMSRVLINLQIVGKLFAITSFAIAYGNDCPDYNTIKYST